MQYLKVYLEGIHPSANALGQYIYNQPDTSPEYLM